MARPQSSFFTPGKRLSFANSYIIVEQAYIQYIPPRVSDSQLKPPILFVHGGGLTGAYWETTPDNRFGWAIRASEAGHPVYILDSVDSGRSARAPDEERTGDVEYRTAQEVWQRFRFGSPLDFERRVPYVGGQFPTEHFDQLLAVQVPRRRNTDDLEMRGVADALDAIGECFVISHSHGATLTLKTIKSTKTHQLVKALICIEPDTTSNAEILCPGTLTLLLWGDYLEHLTGWSRVANGYETGAPTTTHIIHLPKVGITGNSHFPMSDKNSDEVFHVVLAWLNKAVT